MQNLLDLTAWLSAGAAFAVDVSEVRLEKRNLPGGAVDARAHNAKYFAFDRHTIKIFYISS